MSGQSVQQLQLRSRWLIGTAILLISALGWASLLLTAGSGWTMAFMRTPVSLFMLSLAMWSIMMVAMMLPSAAPMILTFSRVQQQKNSAQRIPLPVFVSGYLIVWIAFSLLAAAVQVTLQQNGLLTSAMGRLDNGPAALLIILAGAYQWSPWKDSCLSQCQTPLSLMLSSWHDGPAGALRMGLRLGLFCLGCCWALMLLMFAGGVMNLTWMAALALYILIEKIVAEARLFSRLTGAALIILGLFLLFVEW